jgi:ribonuclease HI
MNQLSRTIEDDQSEGVISRRMVFCPTLQNNFDTKDLINCCSNCLRFFVLCCSCWHQYSGAEAVCHHYRLVFTDGSCLNNGQVGATAGIGVAIGLGTGGSEDHQWSIPIDDTIDAHQKRTSQKAELLAALEGLRRISEAIEDKELVRKKRHDKKDPTCWVIATDSVYVVKGVTEWLPVWKVGIMIFYSASTIN